jgi:hypothetical protein
MLAAARSAFPDLVMHIDYPSDIFPTSRFCREDLGEPELQLSGPSQATASRAPGIGCEPHPGRLARLTLESYICASAAVFAGS